jgi:hypothetical protein
VSSNGVRVTFKASLGSARLGLQVDVGFRDVVSPAAVEVEFPNYLDMQAPKVKAYRKETVVAEKLQAMVNLGLTNSRMKDCFDVWFLSQHFEFDGAVLTEAIRCIFEKRGTTIPGALPLALVWGLVVCWPITSLLLRGPGNVLRGFAGHRGKEIRGLVRVCEPQPRWQDEWRPAFAPRCSSATALPQGWPR